jgi:hypothetical protein
VDVKPDVSRLSREGRNRGTAKETGMPTTEENDDDDVVFIRETKDRRPRRPRRTDEERKTSQSADQRQIPRRLTPQVAYPFTPEPTIPLSNVHPDVGLVLVPATPESIPNPDRQRPSEPVPSGVKRATTIATSHYAKQSRTLKKAPKRRISSSPCGSSGPDPESDPEDESYAGPSSDVVPQEISAKRRNLGDQNHDEVKMQDEDQRQDDQDRLRRNPERAIPRNHESAKGKATSRTTSRRHATLPSSSDDETKSPYRGPHITVLSISSIKQRLTQGYRKFGLAEIDELASWWPKTIVAKHHDFIAGHSYLLSCGVCSWWSDLSKEVRSPTYKWPRGFGGSERKVLLSKVREIALQKKAAAVRAERIMDSGGGKMPSTSVIRLSN